MVFVVAAVIFFVSILAIIELKRSMGDFTFCLLVLFELLLLFCDFVVVEENVDEEDIVVETLVFLTCFLGVSGLEGGGGGGNGFCMGGGSGGNGGIGTWEVQLAGLGEVNKLAIAAGGTATVVALPRIASVTVTSSS